MAASVLTAAPAVEQAEQNIQSRNKDVKKYQRSGDRLSTFRRAQDGACGIDKGENAESTDPETNQNTYEAKCAEAIENNGADERKENAGS